jgi:acyl carrier protein
MPNDVRARVKSFVTSNFYVPDPGALADASSLIESGIVDSTGILEVIAFIEEQFEIHIEDAEMVPKNLESVDNITAFVDRKLAALPPSASV